VKSSKKYSERSRRLRSDSEDGLDETEGITLWTEVVESQFFSMLISVAILANASLIGIQANYMAEHLTAKVPIIFYLSEAFFCAVFSLEISLRFLAYGSHFWHMEAWKENVFDLTVVLLQILENCTSLALYLQGGEKRLQISENSDGVGVLRILRIVRFLRIIRLLRLVHIIGELRAIFVATSNSMRSLCWTVMLLLLLVYMLAVGLTQMVTDHIVAHPYEDQSRLLPFFGSLGSSMLSLFQSISDGVEWRDVTTPLSEDISPYVTVLYCIYVAFVAFAFMNMLTGVFVDKALQSGQADKRRFLLEQVKSIFASADVHETGIVTWADFQDHLQDPQMQTILATIDVDEDDAHELFHLLDAHHEGAVEVDEFVNGCLSLDGPAKAIDLAAFVQETRHMNQKWILQAQFVNRSLVQISKAFAELEQKVFGHGSDSEPCSPTSPTSPKSAKMFISNPGA
jgi:voltage-gated sodium channel